VLHIGKEHQNMEGTIYIENIQIHFAIIGPMGILSSLPEGPMGIICPSI